MDQPTNTQPAAAPVIIGLITPSELFKQTWETYQKSFKQLVGLQLIAFLGMLPFSIVIFASAGLATTNSLNGSWAIVLPILMFVFFVIGVYISLASQGGTLLFLKDNLAGKGVGELFASGRPLAGKIFWIGFLTALLVILGLIAVIIPGIYLALCYSFAMWVLVYENKTGYDAMKRSKELVKGYWWAILGRGILLWILFWIVSIVLTSVGKSMEVGSTAYWIWQTITQLINFVLTPIGIIYMFYIFKDLLRIKGSQAGN